MVADKDNKREAAVAGMDSSQQEPEAADTPSHTVAGHQDTWQLVLVMEEVG